MPHMQPNTHLFLLVFPPHVGKFLFSHWTLIGQLSTCSFPRKNLLLQDKLQYSGFIFLQMLVFESLYRFLTSSSKLGIFKLVIQWLICLVKYCLLNIFITLFLAYVYMNVFLLHVLHCTRKYLGHALYCLTDIYVTMLWVRTYSGILVIIGAETETGAKFKFQSSSLSQK